MNEFFKTIRSFMYEYLPNQRGFEENTIKSYRSAMNLFVEFLRTQKRLKITKITFRVIDRELMLDYLDWIEHSRKCSISTRNHRLMVLRTFFKYAGIMDCTQVALMLDAKDIPIKEKPDSLVDFLTEDALAALLAQPNVKKKLGLRDQFFMTLAYDTAARCSELLNMKVRDLRIYMKDPIAHLLKTKGNKPRAVPVMDRTVEHCKRYLKVFHSDSRDDDSLFYTVFNGVRHQMSPDTVARFMTKYADVARTTCSEVPLNVHPHQFRHTRAIHYYRDGMPLALIAELLGHASVESTKIYAYADTEMKRAAMEKADSNRRLASAEVPIWEDDEEMILVLSGLK